MWYRARIICFYTLPIIAMIGLIPFVQDEYLLTAIYAACILALITIKREPNDLLALAFGLVAVTISELFFVSTGVETFTQHALFGLIPLWLPFLWGYVFVTIKRSLRVLDSAREP